MSDNIADGSDWIDLVMGTQKQEREIPPATQSRIRNALTAEFLIQGMKPEVKDNLSITFPSSDKPSVHIAFDKGTEEEKYAHGVAFEKIFEQKGTGFHQLRDEQRVAVATHPHGGYHARNKAIIAAATVDDLVHAVGETLSNPLIKKQFLNAEMGGGRPRA